MIRVIIEVGAHVGDHTNLYATEVDIHFKRR
jgi:hypothetical protein